MDWMQSERGRFDRFRAGERATLLQVYEVYAPMLTQSLASLRPRTEAPFELCDLVQETFIRAFCDEGRQRFDGMRPFLPYLIGIAQHLALDRQRQARRRESLHGQIEHAEQHGRDVQQVETAPEAMAMQAELQRLFSAFLDGLDETSRKVVQYRFIEDRPRREVSDACGLSAMQLRTLEKKLRQALASRLVLAGYGETALAVTSGVCLALLLGLAGGLGGGLG
jgi:RNA polymerase sigma-70 factor (ECF subfamily)